MPHPAAIGPLLAKAIREKRRLAFEYHGRRRVVEPQCYGLGVSGNLLLRAYQPSGGSAQESLFRVDEIDGLRLLEERFDAPGPHYKRNDSAMTTIYRQL